MKFEGSDKVEFKKKNWGIKEKEEIEEKRDGERPKDWIIRVIWINMRGWVLC